MSIARLVGADIIRPLVYRGFPGGAGLPGRGAAFDVKSGGKTTRACGPWTQGPMAAVSCTDRAKTGPALPPVFWVVSLQALPRPGWHASGLPCKPCGLLRCTGLARRAAVGALPPKYYGARGSWKMARQGCRALRGAQSRRKNAETMCGICAARPAQLPTNFAG